MLIFGVGTDAKPGKCKFCISKHFGAFLISNDGKKVFQSAHFEKDSVHKVLDLDDDADCERLRGVTEYDGLTLRRGVERVHNLQFDEGFGVSGRLLLFCSTKKREFIIHQMINCNELSPLRDAEYRSMPGMSRKPFNLTVAVYEMLFGDDLVETLLHSDHLEPAPIPKKKRKRNRRKNRKKKKDIDIVGMKMEGDGPPNQQSDGVEEADIIDIDGDDQKEGK